MTTSILNPKLLGALALSLFLVACESTGDSSGSAGSGTDSQTAGGTGAGQGGVDQQELDAPKRKDYVQGSQEHLQDAAGDLVYFGFDRYDLTPGSQATLQRQADFLKQFPQKNVTIEGHCDERGTREYNLALGARRAASIKRYLQVLGVNPNRIRTISYGKEKPVNGASNESAWAANRRGVTVLE